MFTYNGYTVIYNDNLPNKENVLVYPTGYKDGNKLGKRKRRLTKVVNKIMIDNENMRIFMHTEMKDGFEEAIAKQNGTYVKYIIERGVKSLHNEFQKVLDREEALGEDF